MFTTQKPMTATELLLKSQECQLSGLDFDTAGWRENVKKWSEVYMMDNMGCPKTNAKLIDDLTAKAQAHLAAGATVSSTAVGGTKRVFDVREYSDDTRAIMEHDYVSMNVVKPRDPSKKPSNTIPSGVLTGKTSLGTTTSGVLTGTYSLNTGVVNSNINSTTYNHDNYHHDSSLIQYKAQVVALTDKIADLTRANNDLEEELARYKNPKTHETFSVDATFDPATAWDRAMSGLEKK